MNQGLTHFLCIIILINGAIHTISNSWRHTELMNCLRRIEVQNIQIIDALSICKQELVDNET
jgi:hypothetical protein